MTYIELLILVYVHALVFRRWLGSRCGTSWSAEDWGSSAQFPHFGYATRISRMQHMQLAPARQAADRPVDKHWPPIARLISPFEYPAWASENNEVDNRFDYVLAQHRIVHTCCLWRAWLHTRLDSPRLGKHYLSLWSIDSPQLPAHGIVPFCYESCSGLDGSTDQQSCDS